MDLIKQKKPDSVMAKLPLKRTKLNTVSGHKAIEGDKLFDIFLKEFVLAGYDVRRGYSTTQDMTVQFAEIHVRGRWVVGMGARLDYFVVWAVFVDGTNMGKFTSVPRTYGYYEGTFKDSLEAMDWIAEYIRSVDALP